MALADLKSFTPAVVEPLNDVLGGGILKNSQCK